MARGIDCTVERDVIQVKKTEPQDVLATLRELSKSELPTAYELACNVEAKEIDKFDEFVPEDLLNTGIAATAFDIDGLKRWFSTVAL